MSKTSKSPAKRAKLEPLSVEEALSSPAVEGMFSFLNIRPEELLHPRALADVVPAALPRPDTSNSAQLLGSLPDTISTATPGIELISDPGLELTIGRAQENSGKQSRVTTPISGSLSINKPGIHSNPRPGLIINNSTEFGSNINPGLQTNNEPGLVLPTLEAATASKEYPQYNSLDRPSAQTDLSRHQIHGPGQEYTPRPGLELHNQELVSSAQDPALNREDKTSQRRPIVIGPQGNRVNDSPGLELGLDKMERSLLVSEIRYTVRRARLVQDGHTSNEQRLYEYLWTHAVTYDQVSRRVSIGFRTLADKVRMARASAQKNLRALVQKLALEVIEGFDVTSSKAPTYRIFNYTEILRRREIAGMTWYVRRTQAVRFVDSQGREIIMAHSTKPGLELTINPGLIFYGIPGLVVEPAPGPNIKCDPGLELRPHFREQVLETNTIEQTSSTLGVQPPIELVKLMQQAFPSIDHTAVQTLWNECQARASDCTVEEIVHFMNEKIPIAKSGKIQNPIGFVLICVPKCFEGETFTSFREEQRRHQDAQRRQEMERQEAVRLQQEQLLQEAEAYRRAEGRLHSMSNEDYQIWYQKVKSSLLMDHPALRHWNNDQVEQTVRRRILRDLQEQELRTV